MKIYYICSGNKDCFKPKIAENDLGIQIYLQKDLNLIVETNSNLTILNVFVYDISGRLLMNESIVSGQEIDVSGLSNGIYLIKTQMSDGTASLNKIIVEH